jgi:hypothetical protein
LSVHTIDPTADVLGTAVRAYLNTVPDRPVRYQDTHGTVTNTPACRGLYARYVRVQAAPDGTSVTVGAIRYGLGRGMPTGCYIREPSLVAAGALGHLLPVLVGMALDDLERDQCGHCA